MSLRSFTLALGIAVAAAGIGSAADAQPNRGNGHRVEHRDNGRHAGNDRRWKKRGHQVRCHSEWRHHRRVRICR